MRTIVSLHLGIDSLGRKRTASGSDANATAAARELVELLLQEQRLIRADHAPLSAAEIKEAYASYLNDSASALSTDPEGEPIVTHVRMYLGLTESDHQLLRLGTDPTVSFRYRALRHSLSILAQMPTDPHGELDEIPDLVRVIEDRQTGVFGLMFQREDHFRFRLRFHTPEVLKAATERVVAALAPRDTSDINSLIEVSATTAIASIRGQMSVEFDPVEMKTPAGEIAQTGPVHAVGSRRGLAWYVAFRSPQYILLLLAGGLVLVDLLFETFVPGIDLEQLHITTWVGGTLERLTTAAFTAYLFAVLLEYVKLRARFSGGTAAFIDWGTG